MRCHHIRDKKTGGRVLIPGCWTVAISGDISDCHCSDDKSSIYERLDKLENEVKKLKSQTKQQ